MKKVEAILKPHKLDDATFALRALGVHGITVTEVRGFGRQNGHTPLYRGVEYIVDFLPKVRIEIICSDSIVDSVIEAVIMATRTGIIGDGKIFISSVCGMFRVRTGQGGDDAL